MDDQENDQYESEEDNEPGKTSINKYFNKNSNPRTLLTTNNNIKLGDGLKLNLDTSITSNKEYRGKYSLFFSPRYNDNQNKKLDASVRYKHKNFSIHYSVDNYQKITTELSLFNKILDQKLEIRIQPKLQLQANRTFWMIGSKLIYSFPLHYGLKNKLSLKFKKLHPQLTINTSYNLEEYHSKFYLDTRLSPESKKYIDQIKFQAQNKNITCVIEHHKSNSVSLHYLWEPFSAAFRLKYPFQKNWWQMSLNWRQSNKKFFQVSFDEKRCVFSTKYPLNSHTKFQFRLFNNYNWNLWSNFRNSIQLGFRFND